jgi:hypothetical protein
LDALSRAVEQAGRGKSQRRAALGDLAAALAASRWISEAKPVQQAFAQADSRLLEVCELLGQDKSRMISGFSDEKLRVAFTRRSDELPFADVSAKGEVGPEYATDAIFVDVPLTIPRCIDVYRKGIAHWIKGTERSKFTGKDSAELLKVVTTLADRCTTQRGEADARERELIECAFSIKPCDDAQKQGLVAQLDAAAEAFEKTKRGVKSGLASFDLQTENAVKKSSKGCLD